MENKLTRQGILLIEIISRNQTDESVLINYPVLEMWSFHLQIIYVT